MSPRVLIAAVSMAPAVGFAQVGRGFTPVEGYVALGESVRVGKVIKLEPTEYNKPLTGVQNYGKPYRLTFAVEETIKGTESKQIQLVLAVQSTRFLEYMRQHGSTVLLVSGPNRINSDPDPEVGVEEDGRPVKGRWHQFLFLDPPNKADRQKDPEFAKQISITFNEGRMFTIDLQVVQGREAILQRARAFAK